MQLVYHLPKSGLKGTYTLISPRGDLPEMSFSQASAHSRMTSRAYLWVELLAWIHNIRHRQHVLLVLALAGESELVLGLSVGDLVDTEPLVGGAEEAREVALNILNVVELRSQGVVDVDDNDLPVGLLLIEKSHHTEDLNLLDLTGVADELTDLANVERVVVTLGLGLGVDGVGVFPGLCQRSVRGGTNFDVAFFYIPGGRHRSSRGNPCGGSSCGRSGACPSSHPA